MAIQKKLHKNFMKLFKTVEEMLMLTVHNILDKKSILNSCNLNLQGSLYRVDFLISHFLVNIQNTMKSAVHAKSIFPDAGITHVS